MKIVNVHQAKTTLSALLSDVEQGEDIMIARNGTPVGQLVRVALPRPREPGLSSQDPAWKGFKCDPALFAPMTDEEIFVASITV